MSVVIKTEGLGKYYHITHEKEAHYVTLRDTLAERFSGMGRGRVNPERETFWALRSLNLSIRAGERVGIIGRNGAGKSTLLKLLSRITEPSTGRFCLRGRVSSLLEVGTGFHPELSGRENIYLNGAILGMSRRDIKRSFDDIVEFSGVEKFLDTPVKRYSSGMHTRLAFAVSAHLQADVMLVDEVLAVGDAEFQKKCLGKMEDISRSGRTVLFVSHNMSAVEQLCDRVIQLDGGHAVEDSGDIRNCIYRYLSGNANTKMPKWSRDNGRFDNASFEPLNFYLADAKGEQKGGFVSNDEEVSVILELQLKREDPALCVGFAIYCATGELLYWSYQTDCEQSRWPELTLGSNRLIATLPQHFLNEGEYHVSMIAGLHFREWYLEPGRDGPGFSFKIQGGLSRSPYWTAPRPGMLAPVISWRRG